MNAAAIYFKFDQKKDAYQALDTLEELGYQPHMDTQIGQTTLHIHVEGQDLTSALEIALAHGGTLLEQHELYPSTESEVYQAAYDLNGNIPIPAHLVNEDWTESYASSPGGMSQSDKRRWDDDEVFDPSGDGYDHFEPGVHL
ncbi:hypothetical protein D3C73_678370 [compost metagenome]